MALDIIIILVLLLLAVLLVILELFFLPGLTLAGFLAVFFYGGALFYAFTSAGVTVGILTLLCAIVLTWVLIYYFMHSPMLDKMVLKTDVDGTAVADINLQIKVGDKGLALSRLNPHGKVLVGGNTVDARSTGEYIEESTPVWIVKIEASTIVVTPIVTTDEKNILDNHD